MIAVAIGVGWLVDYLAKVHQLADLREKLLRNDLERQKLELEVQSLRFKPEKLPERRATYDKLREVVVEITRDARATPEHVRRLHHLRHESEFLFDDTVTAHIAEMIRQAASLHVSTQMLTHRQVIQPDLERHSQANHDALLFFTAQYEDLVRLFKPFLRV